MKGFRHNKMLPINKKKGNLLMEDSDLPKIDWPILSYFSYFRPVYVGR
jgi:hypothetical protein